MAKLQNFMGVSAAICLFLALLDPLAARAQNSTYASTVAACGTPNNSPVVGNPYPLTQDTTGRLCNTGADTPQIGAANAASIATATNSGSGVQAVHQAPTSAAAAAIAPTDTTAVASSLALKSSAGNGYRYAITTGASAGYFLIFDATALPANGAVTPKICRAVAANTSLEIDHADAPDRFSTGIVEGFSTTGCYTLTASATAAFEGNVE